MIRLVYDKLGTPNAIENGGIAEFNSIDSIFLSSFTPYTREEVDCNDKAATRIFVIQPIHFDTAFGFKGKGFIDYISSKALSKLQDEEDGLKLLIFFVWEGYDLNHFDYVTVKYINNLSEIYGIPSNKILLSYGNIKIKEYLKTCPIKLNLPESNIIGINIFNFIAYQDSSRFNIPVPDVVPINRPKRFLFKNGVSRPQRMYLLGAFKSRELLSSMHFSWLNHTKYDYQCHDGAEFNGVFTMFNDGEYNENYGNAFLEVVKDEPHLLDITQEQAKIRSNQILNNTQLYNETYASIVTETVTDEYNNGVLFFSEKTYQPIYNFHPFVNLSGQGVLEQLHYEGFETFPELFDESYDSFSKANDRVSKIIDVVERFCSRDIKEIDDIYSSSVFKDKLIHNWTNFKSKGGQIEISKFTNWLESFNK